MRITQDYSIQSLLSQVNSTRERINALNAIFPPGKDSIKYLTIRPAWKPQCDIAPY